MHTTESLRNARYLRQLKVICLIGVTYLYCYLGPGWDPRRRAKGQAIVSQCRCHQKRYLYNPIDPVPLTAHRRRMFRVLGYMSRPAPLEHDSFCTTPGHPSVRAMHRDCTLEQTHFTLFGGTRDHPVAQIHKMDSHSQSATAIRRGPEEIWNNPWKFLNALQLVSTAIHSEF